MPDNQKHMESQVKDKLKINKTTIRQLTEEEQGVVAGGTFSDFCNGPSQTPGCNPIGYTATCSSWCNTQGCTTMACSTLSCQSFTLNCQTV